MNNDTSHSAKTWFRQHCEWMHDPKVQMMSEADQRRLNMLFCIRGSGEVTPSDELVIFTLRISPEEWARSKALFMEKGFIDKSNRLLNWEKRQYESDTSTERVRRYREKAKQGNVDETAMKRFSNVSVTPSENREQNTETEEDKTPPISPLGDGEGDTQPPELTIDPEGLPILTEALLSQIQTAYEGILPPVGWHRFGGWYPKLTRQIRLCIGEKPSRATPTFWREHFNRIRGSGFLNTPKFDSKSIVWATKPETVGKIENGMWQGAKPEEGSLEGSWEFLSSLDQGMAAEESQEVL